MQIKKKNPIQIIKKKKSKKIKKKEKEIPSCTKYNPNYSLRQIKT